MKLAGKVAVITQAGGGFGRIVAQTYAEEGADLFLQDWNERRDLLEANAEAIRKTTGRRVIVGTYDIATGSATAEMTKKIMGEFGKIDVLVNTGMQGGHGRIFDIRESDWDLSINRGLKSYFLTCQHIGEEMALTGYGKIINLTSIVANLGSGGAVHWGACRGGVNSLTYAMAHALGEYGVRLVALARGAVDGTPYTEEARNERLLRLPLGRLGRDDDVKGPIVFLATTESDWITGSVVYCDGGYAHAAATDREHRATEKPLRTRGSRMSDEAPPVDLLDTLVP